MTTTAQLLDDPAATISMVAPLNTRKMNGRLHRLLWPLLANNIGVFLVWGGTSLMLQALVQNTVGKDNVETNYGMIATIGALFAMFAQPLAGRLSDRTRSRFGRRAQWMIGGAIFGGLSLVLMGLVATAAPVRNDSDTIVQAAAMSTPTLILLMGVAWCLAQATYNFLQGPMSAILPDRTPVGVRGVFSGIIGMATMLGNIGGQMYAAPWIADHNIPAGLFIIAGFVAVVTVLFLILNPDTSSTSLPAPEKFSVKEFLSTFYFDPRKAPDFGWAFLARFTLMLGYFGVMQFQLQILQKYINNPMTLSGASEFVPTLGMVSLVTMLPTMPICGWWSDKIGKRKPFVIVSSLILALSLLVPLVMPTATGMVVYSAIAGLGFGCYMGTDQVLITMVLPSSGDSGKDLGVINIAATLPQVLAPAVAGLVAHALGYHALFVAAIVCVIIGALAIIPIKSVK